LEPGRIVIVGRTAGHWNADWDDRISRRHAALEFIDGRLLVRRLPEARNPIFQRGEACDTCTVENDEHFVIGSTTFTLAEERLDVTLDGPQPQTEHFFEPSQLRTLPFRKSSKLIEALSHLPEIITGVANDEELFVQLVNLLFRSIEATTMVAIVAARPNRPIDVLYWDRPPNSRAEPSERLIRRAMDSQETVVHLWSGESADEPGRFTQNDETSWAFCTPVRCGASPPWTLYVAGNSRITNPTELHDDVKFTELVALTLANLRDLRQLERHKTTLGQFISPVVLAAVADRDPEKVLAPREAEVSVLFCDLRGFSRKSEQSANDLMGLLHRVSLALGVMTRHILAQDGVIGDFHGDSAMGFWGWPLDQSDGAEKACRAALGILDEFTTAQREGHPLADFRVGIGLATGRAVAGKIGTVDQVKVTVFGPIVNLASRLEAMTKRLRASILMDDVTAEKIRDGNLVGRLRRVARLLPYGLDTPLDVHQLLPAAGADQTLSDSDIATYEAALTALQRGDWEYAFELLRGVPAEDRVKDFLTIFIAQNNRLPPGGWDGVIPLDSK
jgi:adenylate cyclase